MQKGGGGEVNVVPSRDGEQSTISGWPRRTRGQLKGEEVSKQKSGEEKKGARGRCTAHSVASARRNVRSLAVALLGANTPNESVRAG